MGRKNNTKKWSAWDTESIKELNLMGTYDKFVLMVFSISFLLCVTGMFILVTIGIEILNSAMLLTAPFFILGLLWYYHTKKWSTLIIIIAVSAGLYLYLHSGFNFSSEFYLEGDFILTFVIDFIFIGSVGVVAFVSALQRLIFYRVVSDIQSMNLKDKMNWHEKLVAFLFNVPHNIDTRYLTMNYNLKRASIPWHEIWETIYMGLMVGIFLWIYISMSPKFANIGVFTNVPVYIFAIVLYIPVIVMPWSIFNALKVRVKTKFRDFELYSGIKDTIKRMVLPMFAALIYVLSAFHDNDFMSVVTFIGTSILMLIIVIVFTSAIYYIYFENKLVDDIVAKWKVFRPVDLLMTVDEETDKKMEFPGTPKRDMKDYGDLTVSQD